MGRKHLVSLIAVTALAVAPVARAAGIGGVVSFGATPGPSKTDGSRSYFSFGLQRGESKKDSILVSNGSKSSETLDIGVAYGTTAQGSGDAYAGAFSRCRKAACWVRGLPSSVTLRPGQARKLAFSVSVPPSAAEGQYLAGITVQAAKPSGSTSLGGNSGVGAHAVVIHQVNVGVALTIGDLATLTRRLQVSGVSSAGNKQFGRLLVKEHNVGQTFLKATGTAVCVGNRHRFAYPVRSDTILPGDATTLPVIAPGLPPGASLSCTVSLSYGGGAQAAAHWRGNVRVSKEIAPKKILTAPGVYSTLPSTGVPRWAIVLIAGGGAVVVLLLVVIVVLLRRKPAKR